MRQQLLAIFFILCFSWGVAASAAPSAIDFPPATANDNRVAAGQMRNGVLTLQLDLVDATWYPEAKPGPSLHVYAFAEHGHAPQIPGPLIRVPQGTEVHASIHNTLPIAVFLRGLHGQQGNTEPVHIAAGETAQVHFTADTPGSYFYTARGMKQSIRDVASLNITDDLPMGEGPFGIESQLEGGFIVDPPGAAADDRIFVITIWMSGVVAPPFREVTAINGKTWPYTERLSEQVGDTVHWRVLNPSMSDHAMHLHGFFFQVTSTGDGEHDHIFNSAEVPHAVTQFLPQGTTMSLTWTPERPGQWLFHCHMTAHMAAEASPFSATATSDHESHAMPDDSAGMAGLVLGVKVAAAARVQTAALVSTIAPRQLRLLVREKPATRFSPLGMGYLIQEGPAKDTPDPPPIPGAPLVLTRGEPADISIVNQLHETTSVHFHGMELESYYDGVPGWSGASPQITPPIPPGGGFVARMTPPRAGTFIYHTHWHDVGQLTSGLYGPLIVLEPGQKFDPQVDKIFLIGRAGPDESRYPLVLNGSPQPSPLVLKAGTRYRLRFINICPNDVDETVSLLSEAKPVQWRALARDGWTLPDAQATTRPARQLITIGQTYDFEFLPEHPGKLELELAGFFLQTKLTQEIFVK